ncbi:MAG: hypothetical protein IKV85_04320 [Ruminococcus sp.]|nr:hypothetical protein [Ruminococcus sp.]
MSAFNDWYESQSIGVQSFVLVAIIIILFTAGMLAILLFLEKIVQPLCAKRDSKNQEKKLKRQAEEMELQKERNAALVSEYKSKRITRKVVEKIKNDKELVSVKLTYYNMILYYENSESEFSYFEWEISEELRIGESSINVFEYAQFAEAVCQLLGDKYEYRETEMTTEGIIVVSKGE